MRISIIISLCCCSFLASLDLTAAESTQKTNEDIYGAITSLVYSFHLLENKLERHEHREKAYGDNVKRALMNLQKSQIAFEPMKGIFQRIDERVNQVETALMTQEEKLNVQAEKLDNILSRVTKWTDENAACKCEKQAPVQPVTINTSKIESNIAQLAKTIENLEKTTKTLVEQAEQVISTKLENTDEVILKLEDKLTHYYVTSPVSTTPPPPAPTAPIVVNNAEFEEKILSHLTNISTNIGSIQASSTKRDLTGFNRDFLHTLQQETLAGIEKLKFELKAEIVETLNYLNHLPVPSNKPDEHEYINKSLTEIMNVVMSNMEFTNARFGSLGNDLSELKNLPKLILEVTSSFTGSQRQLEQGLQSILVKTENLTTCETDGLNKTIQDRFDQLESAIIGNHLETIQNISASLETEISHVWRQLSLLYNDVIVTKEGVERLETQTDEYVNKTNNTLDNMDANVSQITDRMSEVSTNLNYFLGRLSVIATEFNRVKKGLGDALDEIRSSFTTVQNKVKEVKDLGPGPHKVAPNFDDEDE